MPDSNAPSGGFDFSGRRIPSSLQVGVEYQLRHLLGEGGMGSVYFALRTTRDGSSAVALKIVNPDIVMASGPDALLAVRKEVVALGRLNEQVPPTPYVVRMLDTGLVSTSFRKRTLELPWIALEHVHGGDEGTTLHERVRHYRRAFGHGFLPDRAATVLECVGAGLEAVHREGVIHRDLKPGNVLCSGLGPTEVFKISDFGIARPKGIDGTFGNVLLGTPGYVAPEQTFAEHGELGPWTDVFSFAALAFHTLTGEDYFPAKSLAHALMLATNPERRSLTDCAGLPRELAASRSACEELDRLLAMATAPDPTRRTSSALLASQGLAATLRGAVSAQASRSMPPSSVTSRPSSDLEWNVVHGGEPGRIVRRAAWDGEGHCLALTNRGLEYWDGSSWAACSVQAELGLGSLGVVTAVSPGTWVLAGGAGRALVYRTGDVATPLPSGPVDLTLTAMAGDPTDLAVFVGHGHAGPQLVGMTARRWMRPMVLPGVSSIADITRLSDTRWLVCGTQENGQGMACIYDPLLWQPEPGQLTATPLVACASHAQGQAVAVGLGGGALRVVDGRITAARVSHPVDLWSAALDASGAGWAGSIGSIWYQASPAEHWQQVFAAPGSVGSAAFTSLFADVGRVVAMTRDGAVVEGRRYAARRQSTSP